MVSIPVVEIVAIDGFDDCHDAIDVTSWVVPSESLAVAFNWTVVAVTFTLLTATAVTAAVDVGPVGVGGMRSLPAHAITIAVATAANEIRHTRCISSLLASTTSVGNALLNRPAVSLLLGCET